MRRAAGTLLLLAMTAVSASADEADSAADPLRRAGASFAAGVAQQANEAAARLHFRAAALAFEEAARSGGESAALRRAQGNAWLLAGELPRALACYQQARRLEPEDSELQRSLEYARARVAYATPEERMALAPRPEAFAFARRALRRFGLAAIALVGALAWLALARWVVSRRPRWLAVFVAGLAVSMAMTACRAVDRGDSAPVAVLGRSETLRRGDGANFLPRREVPLPPGAEARVLRTRGAWLQVELADGTVGWLPASSIAHPN